MVASAVPLAMGLVILAAWLGLVPTNGGRVQAPAPVVLSLGGALILFALLLWMPSTAPKPLRMPLPALLFLLVAALCNWTAFSPEVRYTSEISAGPFSMTGEDQSGGRVVFGLAALPIDGLIVTSIVHTVWSWLSRR